MSHAKVSFQLRAENSRLEEKPDTSSYSGSSSSRMDVH